MKQRQWLMRNYFFSKSVFITGSSGFVGKVLVEKLLYTCVDITKIYVLVHAKDQKTAEMKIEEMTETPIFSRLKDAGRANDLNKIVPIVGDITKPDMGLTDEGKKLITENVSVVFHLAASVSFKEKLQRSLAINVGGTRAMLKLCEEIEALQAVVYVSTAYANLNKDMIDEKVYPPPVSVEDAYAFANKHGDSKIDPEELKQFLGEMPNCYILTKALAEHVVINERGDTPLVMVRPAIITAAYKEPIPGWIDNWNGPTTLMYAISEGTFRVMYGNGKNKVNLIPVDYVVNTIIRAAVTCKREKFLRIYNCGTSTLNPVTWDQALKGFTAGAVKYGHNLLPLPGLLMTPRKWLVTLLQFLLLIMPCYVMDFFRSMSGQPPKYMNFQDLMRKNEAINSFFTINEWDWSQWRMLELMEGMVAEDKRDFGLDVHDIQWGQYLETYYLGVRRFLKKYW